MYKNDNELDDTPLTDTDYDGVVYEPSPELKKRQKKEAKKKIEKPIKKKKAQNFNFSVFLWATSIMGLIIFFSVSTLVYSTLSDSIGLSSKQKATHIEPKKVDLSDKNSSISFTQTTFTGIINTIDSNQKIITMLDFKDNNKYTLKIKDESIFFDKYDNQLSLSELNIGDIVDCSFDEGNSINYVKKNTSSFSIDNITNFSIDNNTFKFNSTYFKIAESVLCFKGIEHYDIAKLLPLDTVSIKGYLDTIYFISIEKGTGVLSFENLPDIKNATVEIDRDIFRPISNLDTITLSEGPHKIVIKSSFTKPFIKNINIEMGKTLKLDLSSLSPTKSKLLISTNVDDYELFINNEKVSDKNNIELLYGKYQLKFVKEGYNPLTINISAENPTTTVEAKLEQPNKLGKLTISSEPNNAQVLIDNVFVGYTPITYKLPQGEHNVTLKKDGYLDFALSSISIGKDESKFNITLHKKQDNTNSTENTSDKNDE